MGFAEQFEKRIMVTGGAGFIGSNLLLYLVPKYPGYLFISLDCLTYAGNLSNLKPIENSSNYRFEKIDLRDFDGLQRSFNRYSVNSVIHLAAESHVDRSIMGPSDFISTNILGTFNLLEAVRKRAGFQRFHHVSTDEVYGSLEESRQATETAPYNPSSPYAASKASADHLVRAYYKTYGFDAVITNCSNNYGPFQFPEKLIPLTIKNAKDGLPIPVYGDGRQIRDWLYVEDHCRAIDLVFHGGKPGETYNISAGNERINLEVIGSVCGIMDEILGGDPREGLITMVKDRPGHDRRYALDSSRIRSELGWSPAVSLEEGLRKTVKWYLENSSWVEECTTGDYRKYYEKMYRDR